MMEVDIDTSLLTNVPYSFFVRAELQETPGIFAFSNALSVTITCGSEEVTVSQTECELAIQPREDGATIDLSFESLGLSSLFSSSSSQC